MPVPGVADRVPARRPGHLEELWRDRRVGPALALDRRGRGRRTRRAERRGQDDPFQLSARSRTPRHRDGDLRRSADRPPADVPALETGHRSDLPTARTVRGDDPARARARHRARPWRAGEALEGSLGDRPAERRGTARDRRAARARRPRGRSGRPRRGAQPWPRAPRRARPRARRRAAPADARRAVVGPRPGRARRARRRSCGTSGKNVAPPSCSSSTTSRWSPPRRSVSSSSTSVA